MKKLIIAAAAALALAACGQGGGESAGPVEAPDQATQGACASVSQPDAIFGAGATSVASSDIPGATGSCSYASADGLRSADIILYDAASLGATTPDAQVTALTERWAANGVTGQAVEGLGDSAQIAVALPGDQSQIVIRKGGAVATVVATSGDAALTSEALVRQVAEQIAAGL